MGIPKKPRKPCPVCTKIVENPRSKYCSNKCQAEFQYLRYIERWKAGLETGMNRVGKSASAMVSRYVRRYLFEKYDSRCRKCGWSEVNPISGLIPLTIEHTNGNFLDSREENLDLLCPNCHSLTPTYGNLNRGLGRESRTGVAR
jgi:hypothetical protein